jgi:hypothetical protein
MFISQFSGEFEVMIEWKKNLHIYREAIIIVLVKILYFPLL